MTNASPSQDSGPRVTREQVHDLSRLRRASHPRMVAGVAEGLSRHLDIDPLLIRIIFGALTVFGGAGIVLYLIAWLTIPSDDAYDSPASGALRQDPERVMVAGLSLAAIAGAVTLLGAIGFATPRPWAVITVSLVALVLFALFSRRGGQPRPSGPQATPYTGAVAGSTPDTTDNTDAATTASSPVVSPDERAAEVSAWWQRAGDSGSSPPPGRFAPAVPPPPLPRNPRLRSRLTPIALALMILTLGGIWFADAAGADVHPSVYPGSVLAITAAALLLGSWCGRAKLLIPIGLLSALVTAGFVVVGPGPYGERVYAPTTAAAVQSRYEHGAGRLVVNLDEVRDITNLDGRSIVVDSHVGQVQVIVPTSVDAEIRAHVTGGEITGAAVVEDVGNGGQQAVIEARGDDRPHVVIHVDLTFGQIEIFRFDCPGPAVTQRGETRSQDLSTQLWTGGNHVPAACN